MYEDQLCNEWKSVFNHAFGEIQVTDAYGNKLEHPTSRAGEMFPDLIHRRVLTLTYYCVVGVFIQACGLGFHSQCYPSDSVDLGLSFTAMHWLSAAPGSLVGQPIMHAAQAKAAEAASEQDQAAKDWSSIMTARAKELKAGGSLVIVNFCVSSEGYFLGNTDIGVSMWDSFDKCWAKLQEQGLINEEERNAISFPSYYRSKEEMRSGAERAGLKVVECVEHIVRCPYREAWTAKTSERTAKEHAEWFVPTTKTWSNSTFKAALQNYQMDKDAVVEQFWKNYVELVESAPEQHGMDYVHCYLTVEKQAEEVWKMPRVC